MTRAATGYRPIPASTFGAWREQAACATAGVNMFPDPGDEAGVDAALAVRTHMPPLSPRMAERLPGHLRERHAALLATRRAA